MHTCAAHRPPLPFLLPHLFPLGSLMGTATRLAFPFIAPGVYVPSTRGKSPSKSTNPSAIVTSPRRLPEETDARLASEAPRRNGSGGGGCEASGGNGGGRSGRYKSCNDKKALESATSVTKNVKVSRPPLGATQVRYAGRHVSNGRHAGERRDRQVSCRGMLSS